ncbi:Delta-aminolevulinic acid dehydratase, partial [Brevibacterium sp. Mu109]
MAPIIRPRRLRSTPAMRRLVSEVRLHPADLVLPMFVKESLSQPAPLSGLPGDVHHETVIMADLCIDEFTSHGHCGVLDEAGRVDNDATLVRYASMAVAQARAGAHVVGLSGMMDGQVAVCREALDDHGFTDVVVLGYTAKYASAFYGPFREAVDSELKGDRKTYQ